MIQANVTVLLKEDVMDPQGNAVGQALASLGHTGIERVRVGRFFEIHLEGDDPERAREQVEKMCEQLLANTVIEQYRFEVALIPGASAGATAKANGE